MNNCLLCLHDQRLLAWETYPYPLEPDGEALLNRSIEEATKVLARLVAGGAKHTCGLDGNK